MITIQSLSVLIKIRNASEPCYTFFEEGICTIYSQSSLNISSFGTPTIKSDAKPVCVIAGKEKPTKTELRNSIIELLVIIFFSVLASLIANIYFLK